MDSITSRTRGGGLALTKITTSGLRAVSRRGGNLAVPSHRLNRLFLAVVDVEGLVEARGGKHVTHRRGKGADSKTHSPPSEVPCQYQKLTQSGTADKIHHTEV